MNWDALGAVGEIAGAIGVIVTLVYLSIQLRQNTRASKITAIQNSMENSARLSEMLSSDDDLADVFWRGLADPDSLDMRQKRKFIGVINVFMRRESVAYYLHKEGTMPDHLWESRVAAFTGPLNQPGFELYMVMAASTLPADFREFVEELMRGESTMPNEMRAFMSADPDTDMVGPHN